MKRRDILKFLKVAVCGLVPSTLGVTAARAAVSYPQPLGAPGAPFADPNLKPAVLDALLQQGQIDLGSPSQFLSHILDRRVDAFEFDVGAKLIAPAYDYLLRYPLGQDDLDAVEVLAFDGGLDIYTYVWPLWGGETETFDVQSLEGLQTCPNLRVLGVYSMVNHVDLGVLAGLEKLEEIEIGTSVSGIETLLDLPRLTSVSLWGNDLFADVQTPDHPTRRVFDTLKQRGVKVSVRWTSWVGDNPPPAFE